MEFLHLDQARRASLAAVKTSATGSLERILFVEDLFGAFRVVVWPTADADPQASATALNEIAERLAAEGKIYWSGDVWNARDGVREDLEVYEAAWESATRTDDPKIRIADRVRNRGAWSRPLGEPLWRTRGSGEVQGPPVIAFYSFKGGLGRSTSLAAFAIQRARRGERVVVIDFDLDAPGVGSLLAADEEGTTAQWGVVDYLMESAQNPPLREYYHACRREIVTGAGEILVFPAGTVDDLYLGKLARIDFELEGQRENPFVALLRHISKELNPHWVLIDGRTGLSESAGVLLSGFAHLHVLFGTASTQSWQGLARVIDRLGAGRVARGLPQAECVLVQTMVPAEAQVATAAMDRFLSRAVREFTDRYYVEDPEDPTDESFWYVRDGEAEDAPHSPASLSYNPRLSFFSDVAEVADLLADGSDYRDFGARVASRFVESAE
jgi:hypothetical protein